MLSALRALNRVLMLAAFFERRRNNEFLSRACNTSRSEAKVFHVSSTLHVGSGSRNAGWELYRSTPTSTAPGGPAFFERRRNNEFLSRACNTSRSEAKVFHVSSTLHVGSGSRNAGWELYRSTPTSTAPGGERRRNVPTASPSRTCWRTPVWSRIAKYFWEYGTSLQALLGWIGVRRLPYTIGRV